MSPVSEKDLAALMDLGFFEMREKLPRLTGFGVLALDWALKPACRRRMGNE